MKSTFLGTIIGALILGVPVGFMGMTLVLAQPEPEPRWVAGLLGFLVSALVGAIPGGIVGGIVGLIVAAVRRSRTMTAHQVASYDIPLPVAPDLQEAPAVAGYWIGTIGQSLETRATVDSVEPVRDPYAERDLRWLHRLTTPSEHRLRWLANRDRGLSAGDRIVLQGTVKDHIWADAGSVTEMWHCRSRTDQT